MSYLHATCKMFINEKKARYTCIFKLGNELNVLIKANIFLCKQTIYFFQRYILLFFWTNSFLMLFQF